MQATPWAVAWGGWKFSAAAAEPQVLAADSPRCDRGSPDPPPLACSTAMIARVSVVSTGRPQVLLRHTLRSRRPLVLPPTLAKSSPHPGDCARGSSLILQLGTNPNQRASRRAPVLSRLPVRRTGHTQGMLPVLSEAAPLPSAPAATPTRGIRCHAVPEPGSAPVPARQVNGLLAWLL